MNIQKLMKQAQQMQKRMADIQEKLATETYTGNAGGGMLTITINGKGEMKSVKIDPSLIDPNDPEVLEDLIVAAFNNAKKESDDAASGAMEEFTGGMGLPAGFKLPF